ncbi:DNA-directed RNA polymerase subunit alpha [Candidatus Falkowbacteria bacterium RIFOXYC2_FULL_47_12]|uniref:DNA-directed RNA polymerase subunit alpha n=2 Tax=Candidatus Falkowiibacteriota TaxID=1752728 RepID=A0A1F5TR07_9BACT|nr:MAG: DNA-directed RNA polymerase subunit alpha [Candidatus Falkowbacteria bacterium RIFOXYA2_FULL_47_9]OGF41400.1 MAG: DNA-directed RNA polymerase subunit alpha [Candidatus Falkowbacteria bacterium RIFOXYC2_FULL_47_12]
MHKVVLPKKVTFSAGEALHQGSVIVEPCFPGYGTTLGNSLRRVLLSSLPGAAVVGVKIKGADHEFAALEHVKEDGLEILLNLKKLRLKIFSGAAGEVIKLELKAKGEKKLTAKDISKNSQVEIVNEDLHIAEITDKQGSFEAEIFVSNGYGYVSIENREENREKEVGYIELDSIFTPIQAVRVSIENVRVGQMTDWDKLIVDITTDGTIDYRAAFKAAVDILVEQFSFLQEQAGGADEDAAEVKKSKKKKTKKSEGEATDSEKETTEEDGK